jgi:hypothetical protein
MRKALWIGCAVACVITVWLSWYFTRSPSHRITKDGYGDLRLGMTEQEVIEVLGVPAGDYGPGQGEIVETGAFTIASHMIRRDPKGKRWLAGDFAITVCFDAEGRVTGLGTDSVYRPYETITEMLCQKVGLKQKRPYPPGSFNWLINSK